MKKKTAISVCICLAAVLLLCSCGKPTALGIIKDMVSAYGKVSSFEGTGDMELTIDVGTSALGAGVNMELATSTKTDIQSAQNICRTNGKTDVGLGSLGSADIDIDSYTVTGGDGITVYTNTGSGWTKYTSSAESSESSVTAGIADVFKAVTSTDMSLRENTETYNGREVYVIDLSLSGEAVDILTGGSLESSLSELFGEDTQIDMSGVRASVVLKVYKDTKLPAEIDLDLGSSLQSALDAAAEKLSSGVSAIIDIDITMEIKTHTVKLTFDSYNTVDSIEIPQEALDAEESSGASGNGILDTIFS